MLGIKSKENNKWNEIVIDKNDIVAKQEKKFLVLLPNIDNDNLENKLYNLNGFKFWFPNKLAGEEGDTVILRYYNEFRFRLFKQNNFRNSEGKYETIDEKELTGEELKKELDNCLNDYKRISDEK